MENNKLIKILPLFGILIFLVYSVISFLQPVRDEYKLKNDVSFEGVVTDFDRSSGSHGFGIVTVKITKSNTKIFNAFQKEKVYPYTINGSNGEIYNYIPSTLKIGDKVNVNSKKNEISYYENNKFLSKEILFIIKDENEIELIKKVKRLN